MGKKRDSAGREKERGKLEKKGERSELEIGEVRPIYIKLSKRKKNERKREE